jgi:hypothetical protein
MRNFWEMIIRLRPAIFVAVIAFALLSLPTQILELYLIDIQTMRTILIGEGGPFTLWHLLGETHQVLLAALTGLIAILVLWLSGSHLICLDPTRKEWTKGRAFWAKLALILIALAPIFGVLFGEINIRRDIDNIVPPSDPTYAQFKSDVNLYTLISVGLLLVGAAVITLFTAFKFEALAKRGAAMFARTGVTVSLGLILLLTACITIWPAAFPSAIGAQALINLFLAALAFTLTWFSDVFRRTGWPVAVLVVVLAFVFSLTGLNDNHWVDYKLVDNKKPEGGWIKTPGLGENFLDWFQARNDKAHFADKAKPYPVYIVAAEGGGMYAGYHAASFLGRMQDVCPNFAQHVFGISSVSGGSLGAGVFANLAKRYASNGQWRACQELPVGKNGYFEYASWEFFRADLLAPLVGATLFPDLLQRVLPFPIKALDRARALEKSLDYAWAGVSPTVSRGAEGWAQDFQDSLQSLWNPAGAAPALFLQTTNVETGGRYTLSPFVFAATPTTTFFGHGLCPYAASDMTFELPLGSAISLSARFPWLTPAGWLKLDTTKREVCDSGWPAYLREETKGLDRVYLADGAYAENSGLEAAVEMAAILRAYVRKYSDFFPGGVDIKLITVRSIQQFGNVYAHGRAASSPGELLTPIETMLNTREARATAVELKEGAYDDSYTQLEYSMEPKPFYKTPNANVGITVDSLYQVAMDSRKFFLPLGWRLSRRSMLGINNPLWPNTKLTRELIAKELAGEDTEALKRPKP